MVLLHLFQEKACENAYFKMDNVLIDDRRIHVDFSQSVSKIKWKGKGNVSFLIAISDIILDKIPCVIPMLVSNMHLVNSIIFMPKN